MLDEYYAIHTSKQIVENNVNIIQSPLIGE